MPYVKPGVYVTQEYIPSRKTAPNIDNYLPMVMGVPVYVNEAQAYWGSADTMTNNIVEIPLPWKDGFPSDFFEIDPNTVRVVLAPFTETGLPAFITKDQFEKFGLPFQVPEMCADITDWLRTQIVNGQPAISSTKVQIPRLKFASDELSNIVTYGGLQLSQVQETVIENGNTVTKTWYVVSPQRVKIFVYFKAYPKSNSPKLGVPVKIRSEADIVSLFGPVHPANPLGFALYLTFQGSQNGYPVMAVPFAASSSDKDEPDVDEFIDVLNEVVVAPNIYAIAPLIDVSRVGQQSGISVADALVSAVRLAESENYMRKFRIVMAGFKNTSYTAGLSKPEVIAKLAKFIAPIEEKRVRILLNPVFMARFLTSSYPVPGYMYAPFYAGQVAYFMNRQMPQTVLTETEVPVFTDVLWNNNLSYYFSEMELNELASYGYWILYKDDNTSTVKVRHQLTTANTDMVTWEDSIIRSVDFISEDLKRVLMNYVARIVLTEETLNTIIRPAIEDRIKFYKATNICGPKTEISELVIPEDEPDKVHCVIKMQTLFPLNVVEFHIVAGRM